MRSERHLAAAFALILAGCTSASIESSWRSPNAPELTSVVTISPAPDGVTRRTVEDKLAAQLSRHGVHAVPAYTVLADQDLSDRDRIAKTLRAKGFDGVVAMRLVDAHQKLQYYPGFDMYWAGTWGAGGSVVPETVVRIEVNAYSLASKQLVWSAMSKSVDPGSANTLVGDVSKLASDKLAHDRVIGAPQATMK